MHALLVSQADPALSAAEAEALLGKQRPASFGQLLLRKGSLNQAKAKRLALTKAVYEVLFITHRKNLLQSIRRSNFQRHYTNSFAVRRVLVGDVPFSFAEKALADMVWGRLKNPVADLKHPGTVFTFFFWKDQVLAGKLLFEQEDLPDQRRAHLRPASAPVSLHPRLARAMVNLANSNDILDPFCGTGGILIEAGLMGLKVRGKDIDTKMVEECKQNLRHFRIKGTVAQGDARSLKGKAGAIVADLPFGKNSKLAEPLPVLLEEFLHRAKGLTRVAVLGLPAGLQLTPILKKTKWRKTQAFSVYVHKSLSRTIVVLR